MRLCSYPFLISGLLDEPLPDQVCLPECSYPGSSTGYEATRMLQQLRKTLILNNKEELLNMKEMYRWYGMLYKTLLSYYAVCVHTEYLGKYEVMVEQG